MIINSNYRVKLNDGKFVSVDNFERGFGGLVEFDYMGNHYCVRMPSNGKFKTFVGTLNEEDHCYDYKQCTDFEAVKIICEEEYIEDEEEE